MVLEIERGSTRSHPVENSLWKRLVRQTTEWMNLRGACCLHFQRPRRPNEATLKLEEASSSETSVYIYQLTQRHNPETLLSNAWVAYSAEMRKCFYSGAVWRYFEVTAGRRVSWKEFCISKTETVVDFSFRLTVIYTCIPKTLRRAGPSSRGVLPSVVCLKCDREASKNEAA
jgi:hypothetical protein